MNTKPTQEQVKKFWEHWGFEHNIPFPSLARLRGIPNPERFKQEQWYIPGVCCGRQPDLNLDNLFKYAVPKLQKAGWIITLTALEFCGFRWRIENIIKPDDYNATTEYADLAIALFWAIWEAAGLGKE